MEPGLLPGFQVIEPKHWPTPAPADLAGDDHRRVLLDGKPVPHFGGSRSRRRRSTSASPLAIDAAGGSRLGVGTRTSPPARIGVKYGIVRRVLRHRRQLARWILWKIRDRSFDRTRSGQRESTVTSALSTMSSWIEARFEDRADVRARR